MLLGKTVIGLSSTNAVAVPSMGYVISLYISDLVPFKLHKEKMELVKEIIVNRA